MGSEVRALYRPQRVPKRGRQAARGSKLADSLLYCFRRGIVYFNNMNMNEQQERYLHRFFLLSVWLKAFNAVIEVLLGILLLFSVGFTDALVFLAQNELIEDPTDFFATHVNSFATHLSAGAQFFAAFYLLSHGLIKVFLVWGLLRGRLWAYPAAIAFFVLFVVYQIARFARTYSLLLLLLTLFDLIVIFLTWHEYRHVLRRQKPCE